MPAVLPRFSWLTRHCLVLAAGLAATAGSAQENEKLTYDDHLRPLLENKCFSCHNPDKKKGGLELTSYAGLMNGGSGGAVVDAGNPQASRLWALSAHKEEPFMPPEGAPLEAKELALLSKWIAGGLLQAKGSAVMASKKPKVDLAFAGAAGKPAGPAARPEHVLLEPVLVTPRTSAVVAMAASPWTSLLAVAGQKQVLLYDTDAQELAGVLPYAEGHARSLKFSANGSLLILGGGRGGKLGHAVIWDVKTGRRVAEIGKEFDQVMSADISPDHRKVVIGTHTKKVKCFDVASGEELYVIAKHTEWITGADFSPDGVLLATADRNGNVMVWEADNGGEFYALGQHKGSVTDLAWRADSNVLASCAADGTVMTWEMKTGKRIGSWSAHGGNVQSVAFTPDGRVLTAGADGTTALWNIEGGRQSLAQGTKQADQVTRVVALHDGKTFVTSNWLGEVRCFDAATGREVSQLSSNPPKLADRRTDAERRLAEVEAGLAATRALHQASADRLPALESAVAQARSAGQELRAQQAKLAELQAALAQGAKASGSAGTPEAKEASARERAARKEALAAAQREVARWKPLAEGLRAAETALAAGRGEAGRAEAAVRGGEAEVAGLRTRLVALRAAEFNVGVLAEKERLAKLEQDIADLGAAKAGHEAAKVAAAARLVSSRETIAKHADLIPRQQAALQALEAELRALDQTLSPLRLREAEAMGRVETQQKRIDEHAEAIVRLGQERDAQLLLSNEATAVFREKVTTPLRLRLTEAQARLDALKKAAADAKAAAEQGAVRTKAVAVDVDRAAEAVRQAAAGLVAAERAYAEARRITAVFSFGYFAQKRKTEQQVAEAKAGQAKARNRQEAAAQALAAAKAAEQGLLVAQAAAGKAVSPAAAVVAEIVQERTRRLAERDKLAAPGVAAEKEYAAKLPGLQAAMQQAKDGLKQATDALAAVRAQLTEAGKPVEAKRQVVAAAAKALKLSQTEKAEAEKALLAAQQDIPQRDKYLEEIARSSAELAPQVEPLKARVKAAHEQYLAMLPPRAEAKKH